MPPRQRRTGSYIPGRQLDQFDPNAVMWLHVNRLILECFENENDDPQEQDLPGHRIAFMQTGRRGLITMFLTALTTAELQAVREFFNRAFDMAEPVCRELDRRAEESLERGDGVFQRSYRAIPQLVVRESKQPQHYSSLPFGPDGVLPVESDVPRLEWKQRGRGRPRKEVLEPEQGELVFENNEAESERLEDVCPLDGDEGVSF